MEEEAKVPYLFGEELNKKQLLSFFETRKEEQLIFTNPISDYKHLLVNRIIHSMIDLRDILNNTSYNELQA